MRLNDPNNWNALYFVPTMSIHCA
uniref:Uncharacterized protein n=1 Tax=Arundo donax TaxID=35708 RepID=A0A0A9BTW8_ARUDO